METARARTVCQGRVLINTRRPLSEVKRTSGSAAAMSANDPFRKFRLTSRPLSGMFCITRFDIHRAAHAKKRPPKPVSPPYRELLELGDPTCGRPGNEEQADV